VLFFNITRR